MHPLTAEYSTGSNLFRDRLENLRERHHELYWLARSIVWSQFDEVLASFLSGPWFSCEVDVIDGLTAVFKTCVCLSDEAVVECWVGNSYWQYFCNPVYTLQGAFLGTRGNFRICSGV